MAIGLLPLKSKENQNHFYGPVAHRIRVDRNARRVCCDLSRYRPGSAVRPLGLTDWLTFSWDLGAGIRIWGGYFSLIFAFLENHR